ncbi:MAG: exodeoxyribonuclease VII small subunit [Campylobacterales bacterium]
MNSFEEKVARAQQLLKRLGEPDITLKEAVECYREGIQLLQDAERLLEEAKQQIFEVVNRGEKVEIREFTPGERGVSFSGGEGVPSNGKSRNGTSAPSEIPNSKLPLDDLPF